MAIKEIPVYLFVGFLESGKTKFIQETLEDPQFDSGDKTLLLVCEEGEEEYDPDRFAFGGVQLEVLADKSELNPAHLEALARKCGAGRVVLAHLSQENNRPQLALEAAGRALDGAGAGAGDVELVCAPRGECSGWFEV